MSTNARIIRDSLIAVLDSIEHEPDLADRYLMARDLRAITDEYLRAVERRAAYEGVKRFGAVIFAGMVGMARGTVSAAAVAHMRRTGAPEHRPSVMLRSASPFETSNRRS